MNRRAIPMKSAEPTSRLSVGFVKLARGIYPRAVRARLFFAVIWNSNIGLIIQDDEPLHTTLIVDYVSGCVISSFIDFLVYL